MSAAHQIAARVAACRAQAEALLAEVTALVAELPEWREDAEEGSEEAVLAEVRSELKWASEYYIEPAIDYLTPRSDDNAPECCAHRRLQAIIAGEEAREVTP
jgi:hypothetical protein